MINAWERKYVCELEHLLLLLSFQEDTASHGNEWASCWRGSRGSQISVRRQRNNTVERELWVSWRGWGHTPGAHGLLCSSGGIQPPQHLEDSFKIHLISSYWNITKWEALGQHLCLWSCCVKGVLWLWELTRGQNRKGTRIWYRTPNLRFSEESLKEDYIRVNEFH